MASIVIFCESRSSGVIVGDSVVLLESSSAKTLATNKPIGGTAKLLGLQKNMGDTPVLIIGLSIHIEA